MSSGDPLSPTDLLEPFSPPTTPAHLHTPTPHTPTLHTLQVSPYLHPKHLLQDLVLPWKKVCLVFCVLVTMATVQAFLRKWECEKSGEGDFPSRYSYWAGSATPLYYGDLIVPRVNGSLKHVRQ